VSVPPSPPIPPVPTPDAEALERRTKRTVYYAILGPIFVTVLGIAISGEIRRSSDPLELTYLPINSRFTCTAAGFDVESCDGLLRDTLTLHDTIAPTYASLIDCAAQIAACVETAAPRTPAMFVPFMNGILLLTEGAATRSLPVWQDGKGNYYIGQARFAGTPGQHGVSGLGGRCDMGTQAGFLGLCPTDATRLMIEALQEAILHNRGPSLAALPMTERLTGSRALAPKTVSYVKRGGFGQSATSFNLSSKG
jgi:uncharacterized protein YgiB involved in biofilm formation